MNRSQLEHAIRAACDLLGVNAVIVVGSQAILGEFADAPRELRGSPEADIWAEGLVQAEIDRLNSIGIDSPFHYSHGFYLDPVGPETALLPSDWRDRAIRVPAPDTDFVGWCPQAADLAISKLARSDVKDLEFVAAMLFHRMVKSSRIRRRIERMEEVDLDKKRLLLRSLEIAAAKAARRRRRR